MIAAIGILLALASNRLLPYIDEAERIGVLTTESQIRSALVMAAAKRIARGEAASIAALDGTNPMALLLETPANYGGELVRPALAAAPSRSWYFDLTTRHLVYRPGRPMAWLGQDQNIESPEFAVQVAFNDKDRNGTFDPGRNELHGVRLLRVAGFEWLGSKRPPGK